MCGIAGIFKFRGLGESDIRAIHTMTDIIAHRGPDHQGTFISPGTPPLVALGNRRLSIIDLSSAGHQPMSDPTGRYWMVYNGEAYNFQELRDLLRKRNWVFKSHSDTEVLLYLYIVYGHSCLSMIDGMFAMAVWDEKEKSLFLARDRAGKKPLFYYQHNDTFLFSSEIKSLLAHPDVNSQPNIKEFPNYFFLRYVPAPNTMFEKIYKLPPASYAVVSGNGLKIRKYWDVQPNVPKRLKTSRTELEKEVVARFEQAVEKRLIADVPIGVFLSGGIDSSSIVALMYKLLGENIKTYSVGFKSPWLSELEYAKIVADTYKTDHHEVLITPSDFVKNLENIIWYRDLPLSEPADIPVYVLSRMASEKVKVVLSGEGGDEIFGGYYKYFLESPTKYVRALPDPLKTLLLYSAGHLPFKFIKIKHYIRVAFIPDDLERAFSWFSSVAEESLDKILSDTYKNPTVLPKVIAADLNLLGYSGPEALSYLDLKYWLPDNLLERADRLTMANSIELRAPFMDHNLVEFSFSLPQSLKAKWFSTKILLKHAMEPLLPERIAYRKKVGFQTPINFWFRKELKGWLEDIIFSSRCQQRGLFNQKIIKKIFDNHIQGTEDNWKFLWTIINFELWFNKLFDSKNKAAISRPGDASVEG
jgi:asparagine synthase (glutamine-hydrolysing)